MSEGPRGLRGHALLYRSAGKRKTTSAFGVALRAVGRGWKVTMVRFTKTGEWPPGEPMPEIARMRWLEPDSEAISTGAEAPLRRGAPGS